MDKHVIIDVANVCEVFLEFWGFFFFFWKKFINVYGNGCRFLYLCVLDMDGNIFNRVMQNFVAAEPVFWL